MAVVSVPSYKKPDLEESGAGIEEMLQPLPRGQLSVVVLFIDLGLASAEAQAELDPPQFVDERS
jgi:hypothetical protein